MTASTKALFSSYRNHILHCSIYVAMLGCVIQALQSGPTAGTFASAIGGIFLVWALLAEVDFMVKRVRLPPGDSGLPIVGNLPEIIRDTVTFQTKSKQLYGSMRTCNVMMKPAVMFSEEDDVKWLIAQERKGTVVAYSVEYARKLLGQDAIMLKAGNDHRTLRKIFEPAFTPNAVRSYTGAIDSTTQTAFKQWCGEFVSSKEWALLTLRIFFVCAFENVDEESLGVLVDLFEGWVAGFETVIPFAYPGSKLQKAHESRTRLGQILLEMVNKFKLKNPRGSDACNRSVLGRLCYATDEDGNLPSDQVLIDNLRFFLFAGYDTTKGTLGAATFFLAQHPDVYAMLLKEVHSFKEPLDVDEMKNAPILNAVLAETWRLAAPLSGHGTCATAELKYKDYVFPKGSILFSAIHGYNASEDVFSNASQFAIARWLPPDHKLHDPSMYKDIDY